MSQSYAKFNVHTYIDVIQLFEELVKSNENLCSAYNSEKSEIFNFPKFAYWRTSFIAKLRTQFKKLFFLRGKITIDFIKRETKFLVGGNHMENTNVQMRNGI